MQRVKRGLTTLGVAALVMIVFAGVLALYIAAGVRDGGIEPAGNLRGLGVTANVSIVRDTRGIPHIKAQNDHDLYFAEGYVQGCDRLFQMDVYRRAMSGRLAELFGGSLLQNDIATRSFDISGIVADQLKSASPAQRAALAAFSDGVNAAIRTRPLPPEFRLLFNRTPEPFTPDDVLRIGFATTLSLTDTWDDVLVRDDVVRAGGPGTYDAFFPITDPEYDAPVTGGKPAPVASLPPLHVINASPEPIAQLPADDRLAGLGSNDFVAGAALTKTHRSLLANDPHLSLHMPGIWYLVELEAPGIHVAGATLTGVPGVILGHNDHVAWGSTNGTVATVSIYRETFTDAKSDTYLSGNKTLKAEHRRESFNVLLGKPASHDYLRTRHGFVFADRGKYKYAATWTADVDRRNSFETFDELDRAKSAADAERAISKYPGPPQNFVIADDTGNAGYHLAGAIPNDPLWARGAHDGQSEPVLRASPVPFDQLPKVAPSRNARAFTANDRMYGAGYPYRLSAYFSPPYRAAAIGATLAHPPFDVDLFSAIQADVYSPPEVELARETMTALAKYRPNDDATKRAVQLLLNWDGRFRADSQGAVVASKLRYSAEVRFAQYHLPNDVAQEYIANAGSEAFVTVLRMLRDRTRGYVPDDDYDAFLAASLRDAAASLDRAGKLGATWGEVGARTAKHPLSGFGISQWNGVPFPGLGSIFTPHVQGLDVTQSFRAVWDVGAWQNGGIVIPQGESGEPGSPHYRDQAETWLSGSLVPFPFGDAAVRAATAETLTLTP